MLLGPLGLVVFGMSTVITERVKSTISLTDRVIMFGFALALDAATLLADRGDPYARNSARLGVALLALGGCIVIAGKATADFVVSLLAVALVCRFAARVRAIAVSNDTVTKAYAFRTVAYLSIMFLCSAAAIWLGWKLSSVLDTYSLAASTEVPKHCNQPSNTTTTATGIIFPQTVDYKECPGKVWEHIRLNLLFVTQVYTLFTLTTTLHDSLRQVKPDRGGHMTLAFATVAECFLLSAAAVVQFDVIEDCYKVTTLVVVLMCLAVGCLLYRVRIAYRDRECTAWRVATIYNMGECAISDDCAFNGTPPETRYSKYRLYTDETLTTLLRGKLKL